jgi:hypothetical protein
MVHNATRKDRKTILEIKKPCTIVQYSKLMEGVGRAGQYLSFYSVRRKSVKWLKRVVL